MSLDLLKSVPLESVYSYEILLQNTSKKTECSQSGQATFEFITAFFLILIFALGSIWIVWLLAFKTHLHDISAETASVLAHTFPLTFPSENELDQNEIKNQIRVAISRFPLFALFGRTLPESRIRLSFGEDRPFLQEDNSKYSNSQRKKLSTRRQGLYAGEVEVSIYFCLRDKSQTLYAILKSSVQENAHERDCLGQFKSRVKADSTAINSAAPDSLLLFTKQAHLQLASHFILKDGLNHIENKDERESLIQFYFLPSNAELKQ